MQYDYGHLTQAGATLILRTLVEDGSLERERTR
jgi:hypothetical protein